MEKVYDPKLIEQKYYEQWEKQGVFDSDENALGDPYCIMLPPPNVTGSLHMGHAFQHTLMDVLTRYHKMKGKAVLWQPGTDHAGIATQMVVERQLAAKGIKKDALGRAKLIEKIWEWKEESGQTITKQMRRLGNSLDWKRERFTMDEGLSNATQAAFLKLYEDGLIYRGKRLVNWDTRLQTAISDLEVINKPEKGKLYDIRYRLACDDESEQYLVVSTTRPETLFGDVALAVHPEDERFEHLIGKQVHVPLTDRVIPVVADNYVEKEFGTGCLKITPAHDFNDYAVGKRHDLPLRNILNPDGTTNDNVPEPYVGIDRLILRDTVVRDLEAQGLLAGVKKHAMTKPYGDRSGTVIEPFLTDQWFVKTTPLAKAALLAVQDGRIEFFPKQWEKTYFQWMESIEDWCISRQIWWGHRIPAWYDDSGNIFVACDANDAQKKAQLFHGTKSPVALKQDNDVLDTWFSSALWPFSTLGWPDQTQALAKWYPSSVLVTGFDIIFFWVARMVMMGLYCLEDVPFKQVYVTGLIRDHRGQKMSKSKGNVIDPIDLIDGIALGDLLAKRTAGLMQDHTYEKIEQVTQQDYPEGIEGFGVDALRFSLMSQAGSGRDISFSTNQIRGYRNFCNKIWNAARFVLLQLDGKDIAVFDASAVLDLHPFDQWIVTKLSHTIEQSDIYLSTYRFDQLSQLWYGFIWHAFCDWYVEVFKARAKADAKNMDKSRGVLLMVLERILQMVHPVMPFLTESIWQDMRCLTHNPKDFLVQCNYPAASGFKMTQTVCDQVDFVQNVIKEARQLRLDFELPPSQKIEALCVEHASFFDIPDAVLLVQSLTKSTALVKARFQTDKPWIRTAFGAILFEGDVDIKGRFERVQKLIAEKTKWLASKKNKLANKAFMNNAPEQYAQEAALFETIQKELVVLEAQKKMLDVMVVS